MLETTTELQTRLAGRTLELVRTPSESGREEAVVGAIREAVPGRPDDDADGCLLYLPPRTMSPRVLLAGHVDTVPIAGSSDPRLDGGVVHGRGTADMKGGCAVMVELARGLAAGDVDAELGVGFLFFGREEVSADRSPLPGVFERNPELGAVDLALVLEPTDNALEVGCLGNIEAVIHASGVAAHSARPWLGDNAIHRLVAAVATVAAEPERAVELAGLTYREVVTVTEIRGGTAPNVVPDRARATVNDRYAPSTTPAEAERRLRSLVERDGVRLEIRSNSPPAPVVTDAPLVRRLRDAGRLEVRPKQAWTPVAEFAAHGLDAVNLGPGNPALAHRDDERVDVRALARTYEILCAFVAGGTRNGRRA